MSVRFKVLDWWGRRWARVEAWWGRLLGRFRQRRRRLRAEARLIGAEVRQLGAALWDQVDDLPFAPESFKLTPVRVQFYGHGAFMGAAPALLADARWRRILAFLMPDVFEQLRAALDAGAGPARLIPMLENNPVMAAYGIFHGAQRRREDEDESPNHLSGLEWDVFVDGELLEAWERARGDERARRAVMERVLDTTVIAHASSTDTVQEAMGLCQYKDVRKTAKTDLGGVELDSWLDLFGRALFLARSDDLAAAIATMADDPRVESDEECMRHTFASPWPVRRAVDEHRAVTGKPCISVIVEIKSLRSTPEFLRDLVRALNEHGVHVAAVASFLLEEVDGAGALVQSIDGVEHPGPRELQFFHFAGDLQAACDKGSIKPGQCVLFNGASLLDVVTTDKGPVYSTKLGVIAELDEYRREHGLAIGFYVQEGDCDHAAAALLSDLVDARPETFELGFAWGGLRDEASLPRAAEPRIGYGSQRMLGLVGQARQWRERR